MFQSDQFVAALILLVFLAEVDVSAQDSDSQTIPSSLSFRYTDVKGIGEEAGVCRRDPSDVIRVDDAFYVYYTKVIKDELPQPKKQ